MGGFYMQYLESKCAVDSILRIATSQIESLIPASHIPQAPVTSSITSHHLPIHRASVRCSTCCLKSNGYKLPVLVNGREYQTDLPYESRRLVEENAGNARSFSVNGARHDQTLRVLIVHKHFQRLQATTNLFEKPQLTHLTLLK
ncbi:hypothetical protein B0T16DRAFT_384366 [Cercophora newfieldiana]|uniref:Uncharacterized protein n=1 Tax=Cercophora newfieldiana TaxID=92897 RepID=A0AA39YPR6_9PEZI|nr:hypothetical protein B0T16DRAFT_384366 [Cercophora newfieldiana]